MKIVFEICYIDLARALYLEGRNNEPVIYSSFFADDRGWALRLRFHGIAKIIIFTHWEDP